MDKREEHMSEHEQPVIEDRLDDGVVRLTLNRPDRMNAMNDALLVDFLEHLKRLENDDACRAIIITGKGRGFCTGADLIEGPLQDNMTDLADWIKKYANPVTSFLYNMATPTIAAVNGVAAGAGVSLALACDFILCSRSAKFVLSFVKVGMALDMGASWLLTRRIGAGRTAAMALTADPLSAEKAVSWGLAHDQVELSDLPSYSEKLATSLAAKPVDSVHNIKAQIRFASEATLAEALDFEAEVQGKLVLTDHVRKYTESFSAEE